MNRIQNCFYPKVVRNVYTGVDVTCRCGKCPACVNERAAKWVQRLDLESQCHKYTLFCTLTYDDFNVPQVIRLRKDDFPNAAYIDSESGLLIDCRDIKGTFTKSDWQYISDSKVLNVLNKHDFQLFIKRLRYYFNETKKGSRLRYYLAAEYGPRTYRPHGHLLLFFDSPECLSQIEVLLSKAWPYGTVFDPHLVTGSAAEYCASYVNSLSTLPRIYQHRWLRPFTLFSKSPSIGSLVPNLKEVREVVIGGLTSIRVFNAKRNQFDDVPLWRSLENRLFPRLPRFGNLSSHERKLLYSFDQGKDFESAKDFASAIYSRYFGRGKVIDTFFGRYFREVSKKYSYKIHFSTHKLSFDTLPFLPPDNDIPHFAYNGKLQGFKSLSSDFNMDSLVKCCRTILRFREQARVFGLTIHDYLSYIENYYDKKSRLRWFDDYQFQDDYFRTHPKWHWIYFDKSFYDKVTTFDYQFLSDATKFTLNNLFDGRVPTKCVYIDTFDGRVYGNEVLDIPPLDSLQGFRSMKQLHLKISNDLVKQKANNDYALLHKDKFGNIIKYQNL